MTTAEPGPGWQRTWALKLLALFGWRSSFVWPPEPKGVIVVYPHTSNWDFPIGLLFKIGCGLPAHWMGKTTMFRWPYAGLLRRLGGIAIDRSASHGLIDTLVEEYRRRDWMWLAITPEGTRSYTPYLKSGFYQIALAADIPVGLGYIDYATRTVGMDTYLRFSGDRAQDLQRLRAYYATKAALRPQDAGAIGFREGSAD